MMRILFSTLACCLFSIGLVFGQMDIIKLDNPGPGKYDKIEDADMLSSGVSPKKSLQKADELYARGMYGQAYTYYRAIAEKSKVNKDVLERLGKSSIYVRDYSTAKTCYDILFTKKQYQNDINPLSRYHYAIALKNLGDYEAAIKQFDHFIADYPKSMEDSYYATALSHIEGCSFALDLDPENGPFKVVNMGELVNSPVNESGATSKEGFPMIFSQNSGKEGGLIKLDDQGAVVILDDANEGSSRAESPFIHADQNEIFFSRCANNSKGELECHIFIAELGVNGLDNVRELGTGVNMSGFTSNNPTVATHERGQQVLYFTSDRPGGRGGFDLWYSVRLTNGEFTRAYNLGSLVNSDYNEISPSYIQKDEKLYFSSSKPVGIGGYDVYHAEGRKRYWKEIYNMGSPINSSADDYFFRMEDDKNGYLTSNRKGSMGDEPYCCDDIYAVTKVGEEDDDDEANLNNFKLKGSVTLNGKLLNASTCTVNLYETTLDNMVLKASEQANTFAFNVNAMKTYTIEAKATNFIIGRVNINPSQMLAKEELKIILKAEKKP